jgi:flagellar biosynthesis/type III secretory pathway protein FliH
MILLKAIDPLARQARPPVLTARAPVADPRDGGALAVVGEAERQLNEAMARLEQLELEKAELEDQLAASRAALDQAAEDQVVAVAEATSQGRAAGLEAGLAENAEAMERLDAAIAQARGDLDVNFKGLETLTVALAKAALAKVFGDHQDMVGRVTRLVRRQLGDLERATVLRVEVSAQDFADGEALETLRRGAGLDGLEIAPLTELGRGDCRLQLRLGGLDIGIAQQWSRLSGLLDEALAPSAPAGADAP